MQKTLKELRKNPKVELFIKKADEQLASLGYTEHGIRHATWVSKNTSYVLKELGYNRRIVELGEIAGFLHDIGNLINREHHAQVGAVLAGKILEEEGFDLDEVTDVMMAIGNHHEEDGYPVSILSAALILADKADVHRSRVRKGTIKNLDNLQKDIHDRVNYSATRSYIEVEPTKKIVRYKIDVDTKIAPVLDYFRIFLQRMLIASKAARFLGATFELFINDTKMM